jgi:hypothetical protein
LVSEHEGDDPPESHVVVGDEDRDLLPLELLRRVQEWGSLDGSTQFRSQ